jgi:hypothetical protein
MGNPLLAQQNELYVPLDIQKAYHKGTRNTNGNPGPNYWQNRSDYTIKASLDPITRLLTGEETITYTNNSPDTLKQLVIRLYPDILKKGAIRDENVNPADVHDGVNIARLVINKSGIDLKSARAAAKRIGTNMFVSLPAPLLPGKTTTIELSWSYIFPKDTKIRQGTYGQSSFFVAYWYPQVAVYDDIDGWDKLNYTGTQEFYNDFGNFNVEITMPDGYLVWATGMLQNPDEILAKEYASRLQTARTSDQIIRIVKQEDLKKGNITLKKSQHTWKFTAANIPDFAFATSKEYLWDATSVVVDEKTGRRTVVAAAYNPKSEDFYEVARFSQESIAYFSKELPGVPFPYPSLTVFNGSGGMEFPMMVNDGSYSLEEAAEVTAHEIAHTYFPFYMGINERKYAWMDEGWAQMLPNEIQFKVRPGSAQVFSPQGYNALAYASYAGKSLEMPMMTPSNLLTGSSYGFASYYRPGVAYALLKDLLGDELFKKTLREYMNRWNGKHPMPYDFFYTFNNVTGQDLSWYWKPWFFESGYPDLAIKDASYIAQKTKIVIEKKGNIPVPVSLKIIFADNSEEHLYESARAWQGGKKEYVVEKLFNKPVRRVELGNRKIPDVDLNNNSFDFKNQ